MIEFPSGWEAVPLGEVVDILDSRRIPLNAGERAARRGDVPYYGASGQVGWVDAPIFNEPLVLLGEDGVQFFEASKQKAYLVDGPTWVNNHAHVLRARPVVDRKFLTYWLNTVDYRGLANGTTRLKLTQAAMKRIGVPLPPLPEQHRIVAILEANLSLLDVAGACLDAAQRRAAVLHNELLRAELAAVDSEKVPFAELLTIGLANGKSVPTQHGGFPVLRLTSLRDGRIELDERKAGAWTADDASRFLVQRGDFLISRGNGSLRLVGRGGLVVDEPDSIAFPDTLIRARPDTTRIRSQFLALVWNAPGVRRQIEKAAKTTAGIYKVNQKDLNAVLVDVPSLEDQCRVVESVLRSRDALTEVAMQTARSMGRSAALRRSLFAAAFSGRLTVVAPDFDSSKNWPSSEAFRGEVQASRALTGPSTFS